ncbi:MAG: adenosylcobinamide-GDP ribazoletransferase [Methanobacteriota archaeon]|nr:MAG: adenosylcobinamide-GDP ribazoletransferase [Euryarchaeota archaeon]
MTRDLFGLLTRIKLPGSACDIDSAARQQHLFPMIGLAVGLLLTIACLAMNHALEEDESVVAGGLLLVLMYALTGIMHTEGMADFADGVMASGAPARKREIMKDPRSGVAAVLTVVLFVALLFALAWRMCARADHSLDLWPLPWSIPFDSGFVVAEVGGKIAMNMSMAMGPSSHRGMGTAFVQNASTGKLLTALATAMIVSFFFAGLLSIVVLVGAAAGVIVTFLARKHFGGVSGDVFGAANEVGRLSVLLTWVLIL